ncbi:MAG: response regulator [Euryarchaeota archaeon]|nr:response regulator [Euryarchaeota archaeon]
MARIMVVDDEPDILFLTGIMLKKRGYEIIEASSGEECLDKLKKEKPDLILLDILGVGGDKILEKIKNDEKFKSIPVVMFTVVKEEKIGSMFECAGYDAYIEKPFERDKMLATVQSLLAPEKAAAQELAD